MKTTSTPIETNKALLKDEEAEDVDVHLYKSMIGSLMYLTTSQPNLMFSICACARFQVTPKVSHLHAVKRIFRYLKGQPKLGLWYPRDSPFDLEAFSDSDYAGASLDRKSTIGGCQFLGKRLISWRKKANYSCQLPTKAGVSLLLLIAMDCCNVLCAVLLETLVGVYLYGVYVADAKFACVQCENCFSPNIIEGKIGTCVYLPLKDCRGFLVAEAVILPNMLRRGSELEVQRLKRAGQEVLEKPVKYLIVDWGGFYSGKTQRMDLVKERFSTTEPTDDKEKELWVELKRLFKPDNDDILWKLQRYMHDPLVWRLYDTCGVHHVSSVRGHDIFMLVEKEYPLTRGTLGLMMVARLLVEADSEMSRELLRKIFYQANRPR
ncbi:hypothetical protein Tco_1135335 [Tanacetum coccineum]